MSLDFPRTQNNLSDLPAPSRPNPDSNPDPNVDPGNRHARAKCHADTHTIERPTDRYPRTFFDAHTYSIADTTFRDIDADTDPITDTSVRHAYSDPNAVTADRHGDSNVVSDCNSNRLARTNVNARTHTDSNTTDKHAGAHGDSRPDSDPRAGNCDTGCSGGYARFGRNRRWNERSDPNRSSFGVTASRDCRLCALALRVAASVPALAAETHEPNEIGGVYAARIQLRPRSKNHELTIGRHAAPRDTDPQLGFLTHLVAARLSEQ